MTWALCLMCGNTKFGAFCRCKECGVSSTGDGNLDITFSDHNIARKSLEDLGSVIKSINLVAQAPQLRFDTFLLYISQNHPDILRVELDAEDLTASEAVLREVNPVVFEVLPGRHRSMMAGEGEGEDGARSP